MIKLRSILQTHSAFGILWVTLTLSQGCARQDPGAPANAGSSTDEQKLPFRQNSDQASADDVRPAIAADPKSATGLPFRAASHLRILPSGTLLTVQLEDSLSTSNVHAGDVFSASVAAPLTIDGDIFIERGTAVTGLVESAQSPTDRPGLIPGSGYFRLALNAITIEGRPVALQTSSLFARGTTERLNVSSRGNAVDLPAGVQVHKGRRLTFRLTAPVTLNDPNATANRQFAGPISE